MSVVYFIFVVDMKEEVEYYVVSFEYYIFVIEYGFLNKFLLLEEVLVFFYSEMDKLVLE